MLTPEVEIIAAGAGPVLRATPAAGVVPNWPITLEWRCVGRPAGWADHQLALSPYPHGLHSALTLMHRDHGQIGSPAAEIRRQPQLMQQARRQR